MGGGSRPENWMRRACGACVQAIHGRFRGASGVFPVKQKSYGRKESPPCCGGGLEGGEMGEAPPTLRHCRGGGVIGQSYAEATRDLLIKVEHAYAHGIINIISLVTATPRNNFFDDSLNLRFAGPDTT